MDAFDEALDYRDRHRRARERMAARGLDALLLTGGPNLTYFTGVSGMLGANSGSRPLLYVLPLEGQPVLVAHRFLTGNVSEAGVDLRVVTYDRLSSLPARQLREALEALELSDGRIGAELGPETTLSVPAGEFTEFVEASATEVVDAQPLLVDLRCRKSAAEVERIERACELTAAAFERTFDVLEAGMTGAAVESLVCRQLLEAGGRAPWALVTGGGDYGRTASGGDDRSVRAGDMVWIDCGCAVDGYWSDYSRAGVVGGASAKQRDAQRAVHEITREAVEAIEPGVTMSSVARRAEEAVEVLDLPITDRVSQRAGRMGHGLGVQVTELPSLCADTDRTFEPGAVVTVEPAFATAYGTFHVEENVVVTETGSRTLSDDRWQLRSI